MIENFITLWLSWWCIYPILNYCVVVMFNPCRTPHHHKDILGNGLGGVPQAASVLSNPPKPCPLQIHVEIAGTYLPAVWSYRKQVSWNKILFVQHFSSMWKYGLCDKDSEQDIHSTIFNRNQIKCLLAAGISISSRIPETLPFCIETLRTNHFYSKMLFWKVS